jgi:phosphotriesterase-related protein
LLSQDICHRISLRRYGGWGYAHLAVTVVPQLLAQLDQPAVDTILRHNPLTLLTMPGATS